MDEIRPIPDKELGEFVRIASAAYPGLGIITREDYEKTLQRLREGNEDSRNSMHGVYRDGRLIAGIRLHDYTITLRGTSVPAGGGGFLAVDLPYKKEQVAKQLMAYYFRHYINTGTPIAMLWPFRPDFYHKMGCGYGSKIHRYAVIPRDIPKGPTKEHVDWLTAEDIGEITACYNRYAEHTNGMVHQTVEGLRSQYSSRPQQRMVGCRRHGSLEGYMVFSFEKASAASFLTNNIVVSNLIYETREALRELLTFLHVQDDQIDRVIFLTNDDYFHYLLYDPRNDTGNLIDPIYHESHQSGIGIMYRVLDVKRLFELLAHSDFDGATLTLEINLTDSFLPEQAGQYQIAFEKGTPRVVESANADVEIQLDVAEFSSLVMGAVDFRHLHTYSLAEISNPGLIDTVNRVFAADHKPVCITPF